MSRISILSRSRSFERHLVTVAVGRPAGPRFYRAVSELPGQALSGRRILLVHAPSYTIDLNTVVARLAKQPGMVLGIAADTPRLEEMLMLTQHGIHAYFNSYMADIHYQHMLNLLVTGHTWFAPDLLLRALELARRSVDTTPREKFLEQLTPRQREVALAVAEGMSNKKISTEYGITERTVKTHLTHIFRTLELDDRVALAIKLSGQPGRTI